MNTNRSAASENPQFRVVIQFTMLSGIWSRKIAQFATPRNRSSRRSRPFSGRVALIFMGAVSKGCFREDRAADVGAAARSAKIVTAQHNDYTGQEPNIQRQESPVKFLKGDSILYQPLPPRASMSHISRGPDIHDRSYL